MFDSIEKLKRDFTDKYVVVEAVRPELSRFKGHTGVVKTVNMNGRALVEFDANDNIGWYDIDLGCLKVVDRPPPKAAESKPAAKPAAAKTAAPTKPAAAKSAPAAGEKKMSPLEMARAQGAAKTGDAPKKSTADVLAAARGGQAAAPASSPATGAAKPPAGAKSKLSTADVLAAARAKTAGDETAKTVAPPPPAPTAPAPAATAAKPPAAATGKKTTAEILAAARGGAASATKAPATEPVAQVAPPAVEVVGSVPDQPISEQPVASPSAAAPSPAPAVEKPAAPSKGDLPKTTAEIIAWCRQRDAKG